MCTVTFVPYSSNKFVLTSNRDEAPSRNTIAPKIYEKDGAQLLFPKDELAGGTWIGASNSNRLICLLNGGFDAHDRAASYRLSRGIIVTDLLAAEDAEAAIENYSFEGVEPFTLILVSWYDQIMVSELVWDGAQKHFSNKPNKPHIWSSSLLYTSEVKEKRRTWFSEFMAQHTPPSEVELLRFHKTAGDGDTANNLIMDRGFVKTKSISQFLKNDDDICFRYEDLQQQKITSLSF